MKASFIYSNLHVYRLFMNVLYRGGYSRRFDKIVSQLRKNDKKILELCFGDVYIAEYCKSKGLAWEGVDINMGFVDNVRKRGFSAFQADLFVINSLPAADVCVMSGSLYHFHEKGKQLIRTMIKTCSRVILLEPVVNVSQCSGLLSDIALKFTDAGRGKEAFRFTKCTLLCLLDDLVAEGVLTFDVISFENRDLLVVIDRADY